MCFDDDEVSVFCKYWNKVIITSTIHYLSGFKSQWIQSNCPFFIGMWS